MRDGRCPDAAASSGCGASHVTMRARRPSCGLWPCCCECHSRVLPLPAATVAAEMPVGLCTAPFVSLGREHASSLCASRVTRRVELPVRGRVQPGRLWWRLAGPTVYSLLDGETRVRRVVHHSASGICFSVSSALRHCVSCKVEVRLSWQRAAVLFGGCVVFFVLWLCVPFFPSLSLLSSCFSYPFWYTFLHLDVLRHNPWAFGPLPQLGVVFRHFIEYLDYKYHLILITNSSCRTILHVLEQRGAGPRQPLQSDAVCIPDDADNPSPTPRYRQPTTGKQPEARVHVCLPQRSPRPLPRLLATPVWKWCRWRPRLAVPASKLRRPPLPAVAARRRCMRWG